MKIAILSMQRVKNYGSVLQAYSLKKIIENITGETVDFIDPKYDDIYPAVMPIIDADDYKGGELYSINKVLYFVRKIRNHYVDKKFCREIEKFQARELLLNESCNSNTYDIVVEGSDEVFKCTRKVYRDLYGCNKNGNKLITYAASCGSADIAGISSSYIDNLRNDMKNFSAISVRDDHTKEYIAQLYDGEISMHMDPVLMGDLNQLKHGDVNEKDYMIVYAYANRIRSKEEVEKIKAFAKKHGLQTIAVGAPQAWCDKYIAESPFRTLDYFNHAKFIVTDTFHGTIFSVINHANFVSIIRKTNRNKMSALLEQLGLTGRILNSMDELEAKFSEDINYQQVDEVISAQRERTYAYLKEQLV